jgi:hypothetical protein
MAVAAIDLIELWEEGFGLSSAARAGALARRAPVEKADDRGGTAQAPSVGASNARLLALRRALFGSRLVGVAACPHCGARMEVDLRVEDLLIGAGDAGGEEIHALDTEAGRIEFRLPTLADLAALDPASSIAEASEALLRRCLVSESDRLTPLPPALAAALAERMAALDPLGDVALELDCDDCGASFQQPLDMARWLWREIETGALRLLEETHRLASAYGWSERDILAMTPMRRQVYLDLISP